MHMRQQADWKYQGEMTAAQDKGMNQGIKEGKKEGIIKIAKHLKSDEKDTEYIAKITGLEIKEIEKL
ncbi:hypothetical protein ALNOE001_05240 [Candidatus Methanobinarius endosymbioticus]|uniref:Transposase/invertase (TIGR01784 family) n=1 Tax=Candidatus Methanobinarius endosymbioticus TaxID=2006182 RepID=A0A366MD54_9EURY|nr:hypothetical protein ALNOE001_05240 [Candidatus Methanobinarius endosymbioticus]